MQFVRAYSMLSFSPNVESIWKCDGKHVESHVNLKARGMDFPTSLVSMWLAVVTGVVYSSCMNDKFDKSHVFFFCSCWYSFSSGKQFKSKWNDMKRRIIMLWTSYLTITITITNKLKDMIDQCGVYFHGDWMRWSYAKPNCSIRFHLVGHNSTQIDVYVLWFSFI